MLFPNNNTEREASSTENGFQRSRAIIIVASIILVAIGVILYLLLGKSSRAAEGFSALIEAIIDRETTLEGIIAEGNGRIIVDRAWRAYGQMLYARLLDESDLLTLSSALRFSLAATEGKAKLPPVTVKELNLILGECLNASITATSGCNSDEEIATSRAEIVSKMIYTATGG